MQLPKICLIVPVYNEYLRLDIHAFTSFLNEFEPLHIIFVNDASKDDTKKLLEQIKGTNPAKVTIINHTFRLGKAEAIRSGMLAGSKTGNHDFFGFIDADLAVPLNDIIFFVKRLSTSSFAMALGSRAGINNDNINRTAIRNALAAGFRVYLHKILKFKIADSQCGAKVFKAEIIPILFSDPFQTHWLLDIELMMRYGQHFLIKNEYMHEHVLQIPVSKFEDRANSKFNIVELIRTVRELILLSRKPTI